MRTVEPALMPIFRSQPQADLLAWLYLHPDDEYSLTELAGLVGVAVPTVHREAERLVRAGLLADRTLGRNRMLKADLTHPAADPLRRLLEVTFGPRAVIGEEFAGIPGADQVLIFGSWAARHAGRPGPFPHDVDVLVIGDHLNRSDIYAAADRAQARLGLPVNPTMRTHAEWTDGTDPLAQDIHAKPALDVTAAAA